MSRETAVGRRYRWCHPALVALTALALSVSVTAGTPSGASPGVSVTAPVVAEAGTASRISTGTFERRLLRQINIRRESRNLRKVRIVSDCLDRFAEDWAMYLAATGLLVHRDQNLILARCGMTWAGEALVRGTGLTPTQAVKAWMASATHRAVIMKRRANRSGVGVQYDAEARAVVVLNFGDAS